MNIGSIRESTVFNDARKNFRKTVAGYNEKFTLKKSTSRARDWQPFRMCTRDMILTMIVLRKDVRNNAIEVDTCLIDNITQFEDHYSTMVALSVIISEAFKRSTKMEIHFTKNVEGGKIPLRICEYAEKVGLKLKHKSEGVLLPSEARLLYLSITELSKRARDKAIALHESKKITVERVCFMVHNGVWKKDEMESILLGHPDPTSLLLGRFPAEYRVPFLIDSMNARFAVFGGAVDRIMKSRSINEDSHKEVLRNDREVKIDYDPRHCMKVYRCLDEEIILTWRVWGTEDAVTIPRGEFIFVRLMPRSANELRLMMEEDIRNYSKEMSFFGANVEKLYGKPVHHFFAVASEFQELGSSEQEGIATKAMENRIKIIIFPHTTKFLDEQGMNKLNVSRRLRR